MPPHSRRFLPLAALVLVSLACLAPPLRAETTGALRTQAALSVLAGRLRTGVLYDRVLPLAHLERLDGSAASPVIDAARWRQGYDELRRASAEPSAWATTDAVRARARADRAAGLLPIAVFDRAFERIQPAGAADRPPAGSPQTWPLARARTFAAAVLAPPTFRGGEVRFELDPDLVFADRGEALSAIEMDFDDGLGFRRVRAGQPVTVRYAGPGTRTLTARITRTDGSRAVSRSAFGVSALATPSPDDTLHITASVDWQGQYGTGDAYVYLAPGHATLTNPVVVIEGFDLDNSMNWDELYALLNQENLLEDLRADGYDAVVLNFTDATDAVQKNGLVVAELIQEVDAAIAPTQTIALVGASMGGLCSRYALDWLETNAITHRVRTWISFDGPHGGADIPLGLQYWINFFSSQSTDAANFLAILNRPAARQMLIYHFTTPAGATGEPDPLRASMLSDFASLGDWPTMPRRVSIANGSGTGIDQGYSPATQVIRWEYSGTFVDITGDIWALPDAVSDTIFAGKTRILFTTTTQYVIVSGTAPWDGAPGGWRASFAELDSLQAPYGDIMALYPNHCFIPSVSSLAIPTGDPFFDIAGTADLVDQTPFDAIYWPTDNQSHVLITPENAVWVKNEIEAGQVSVPPGGPAIADGLSLAVGPNPSAASFAARFVLDRASPVTLRVVGVDGREVRRLSPGRLDAGPHRLVWDGQDAAGGSVPAGIYFLRLQAGSKSAGARVALIR